MYPATGVPTTDLYTLSDVVGWELLALDQKGGVFALTKAKNEEVCVRLYSRCEVLLQRHKESLL